MATAQDQDWDEVVARLNKTKSGKLTVQMGSPGSAQVTRCRLLESFTNLRARTEGAKLHLSLAA